MGRLFFSTYISSNKVWLRIILYFNLHSMIKNFVVQILVSIFLYFQWERYLELEAWFLKPNQG